MYCIHVQIRNFLQSDVIYHKLWLLPWHAATIYMQFSLVALLALLGTHLITLHVYHVLHTRVFYSHIHLQNVRG